MKSSEEKKEKLTPAQLKRQEKFLEVEAKMASDGYEMKEHTISALYANVMAVVASLPFFLPVIVLYAVINDGTKKNILEMGLKEILLFLLFDIVLVVLHEAVHGITWALFAKNHFRSIEFGIMKELLTPYCTCSEPLKKGQYILGTLMPLFVVGLVPSAIAILLSRYWLLLVGVVMIIGAGGDIIISFRMLKYKSEKDEVIYYDHPTKCGFITFEK